MKLSRPRFRRRILSLLPVAGLAIATAALVMPEYVGAAPVVCPSRSQGDRPFTMSNIGECVWVNNDHNRVPVLGETVDYNIYCPGRIPVTNDSVGQAIVNGQLIKNSDRNVFNPILAQHTARRLKPVYVDTPHVFHYNCVIGSSPCVATHIKVRVRATAEGPGSWPKCTAFGSQNGDIALNARMDREYRCNNPMFHSSHRGGFGSLVKRVAADLLRKEDVARAKKLGGKVCLLASTDIQCAPCTSSDKLIVRVQTVPLASSCPANSLEIQ